MPKNKTGLDQVLVKNKRKLAWREVDGELTILHIPTNGIYRLNSMGLRIWDQIDGQKKTREIAEHIRVEFDVGPKDELEKDVAEFVDNMINYDILKSE